MEGLDEILVERNLFRRRAQEYRERCAHLESKNARLKDMLKQSKTKERVLEKKCEGEVADLEARLAGALMTIDALKQDSKEEKIRYRELLCAFNERTAEVKAGADGLNTHYEVARTLVHKTREENERLEKEVGDLRRLNMIFMLEIQKLNKQLNE